METYAASMPDSERTYRNVVSQLATELQKKNELLVEAENRNQQLQTELDKNEKASLTEIAEYQGGLKKATDDLAGEIDKFGKDRDKFKKGTAELAHKLENKQKDFDEENARRSKELEETTGVLAQKTMTLEAMINRSKGQELSAEMSDGKVTWVSQRDRVVYLNIGTDDGLRPQNLVQRRRRRRDEAAHAQARRQGQQDAARKHQGERRSHQPARPAPGRSTHYGRRSVQPDHAGRSAVFRRLASRPSRAFRPGRPDAFEQGWPQRSGEGRKPDHGQRRRDRRRAPKTMVRSRDG